MSYVSAYKFSHRCITGSQHSRYAFKKNQFEFQQHNLTVQILLIIFKWILRRNIKISEDRLFLNPCRQINSSHISISVDTTTFNCALQCMGYQYDTGRAPRIQNRTTASYRSSCGVQFVVRTTSRTAAYGKWCVRHSDYACVSTPSNIA